MIKAYLRLREEYLQLMTEKETRNLVCPSKISFPLEKAGDITLSFTNIMAAITSSGTMVKSITVDDEASTFHESFIYTPFNTGIGEAHFYPVTVLRCALMATFSVDHLVGIDKDLPVGFIGAGRINLQTFKSLNALFGVTKAVVRGSKKDRWKNLDLFRLPGTDVICDDSDDLFELNQCQAVFCCTTSTEKEDQIDGHALDDVPIVISQDGGYALNEKFRRYRKNYTDHKEQLMAHYADEFPHDLCRYEISNIPELQPVASKIGVYLYGIAYADAVVLEEMIKEKKRHNG